tara:strand:- start:446 stop:1243 length:798 start_codon:yes stop_codon:yes gene_type:complete
MNKTELKFVHNFLYNLSKESRNITLNGFEKVTKEFDYKYDSSPVTKYDIQAEKKLRNLIIKNFPNHNVYGEEIDNIYNSSDYTWIIDPIDGTKSFLIGRPLWGTMIGLIEKNNPIIGLVDFPALDQVWLGDGSKCYFNKKKINFNISQNFNLSKSNIASTDPSMFGDRGLKKYNEIISISKNNFWSGDCHNYILLISGSLDAVIEENLKPYDILPLIPILNAKDIIVTDWQGKKLKFNFHKNINYKVIASKNTKLHNEILNVIND